MEQATGAWLRLIEDLKAGKSPDVEQLHTQLCWVMIVSGVATFVALLVGPTAPYGRYSRAGWGILVNPKLAWLTQEIPSLLVAGFLCWRAGPASFLAHPTSARTLMAAGFLGHYVYRSLIYPFRLRSKAGTPLSIWAMSFVFCIWNGFLQGHYLARQAHPSAPLGLWTGLGFSLQLLGLANVMWADHTLLTLRKPGETGYKIPRGGLFSLVSCANYTAEILEWAGYATASGFALAPCSFSFFVFCNLAPRGAQHHAWYKAKFGSDYPKARKAVVPFVW